MRPTNEQQTAAILAGLRLLHLMMTSRFYGERVPEEVSGVFTDDDTLDPMSAEQVDELADYVSSYIPAHRSDEWERCLMS